MTARDFTAPVEAFSVEVSGTGLSGHAAPAGGSKPAGIVVRAGTAELCSVRATAYSALAAAENQRFGWCGFTVPNAADGFALADEVSVHCGATDRELARLPFAAFSAVVARRDRTVSVAEMLSEIRLADGTFDPDHLVPVAQAALGMMDWHPFVRATASMILGSEPAEVSKAAKATDRLLARPARSDAREVIDSLRRVKRANPNPVCIPGPYHPDFKYGAVFR